MTYRLPSMIVLQPQELRPLTLSVEGWSLTIHEPAQDEQLSIRGAWQGGWVDRDFRYGDVVRVSVAVPETTALDHGAIFASVEPVLRRSMRRLLTYLQVETRQAWIGYQPTPLPWADYPLESSLVNDSGRELPEQGADTGEPEIPDRYWLMDERWVAIGRRLAAGEDLSLPELLLEEATALRFMGNVRLAVLSLAMACEVAMKAFVREVGGARDPLYAYVVERDRELSILDYLGDVLELLTRRKAEDVLKVRFNGQASGVTDLKRLFAARNKVAHEGRASYRTGSGAEQTVDDAVLDRFRVVAARFVGWLRTERDEIREERVNADRPADTG